jgi:3-hydroxyisobutyrate dehydrogenase-like beta-hydroxyacid dehydrogenase
MALALLRAGWRLSVLDSRPERAEPCVREGARLLHAASELADCGVVALVVPDDAAVESVLEGPDGIPLSALRPLSVVVVHSTVLPGTARRLAEAAARHDVGLVDAPVSGGDERALAGDLTVMVGGEPDVVERARPLLDCVGSQVIHVGPPGAGEAAKLANQLMLFAALAGTHEALDLARRYGVDEQALLAAVATGTGDCWAARNWGFFDRIAAAYDEGGTPVSQRPWSKDLWEIVAAARAADVQLPVAGLLAQYLAQRVESHAAGG